MGTCGTLFSLYTTARWLYTVWTFKNVMSHEWSPSPTGKPVISLNKGTVSRKIFFLVFFSANFRKKSKWMVLSEAWGKLIHVENRKSKISWHCPFKLFLAENTSFLGRFFRDQELKIPRNPEIPDVFPARKSSTSDAPAGRLQRDVIYFHWPI